MITRYSGQTSISFLNCGWVLESQSLEWRACLNTTCLILLMWCIILFDPECNIHTDWWDNDQIQCDGAKTEEKKDGLHVFISCFNIRSPLTFHYQGLCHKIKELLSPKMSVVQVCAVVLFSRWTTAVLPVQTWQQMPCLPANSFGFHVFVLWRHDRETRL